jgi:hypothetical protein
MPCTELLFRQEGYWSEGMILIGRVKKYELGNIIVSVPGEGDRTYFIVSESRNSAKENFPEGTPVKITLGDTKVTKGTVMDMEILSPEENAVLIGHELESKNIEIQPLKKPPFTHAVLPEKKKGVIPDVAISPRDALIVQQSCLNRAVDIYEITNPIVTEMNEDLPSIINRIIEIKDTLFVDLWQKSGMIMKEKKE